VSSVAVAAGGRPTARPSPVVIGLLLAVAAIVVGSTIAGTGLTIGGVLLAALLIILQRPDAATAVVLAAIYSNAAVVAVRFHNVPALLAVAMPLALMAPLAYHVLIRRQPIIMTPAFPWLIGFLMAQVIATAAAQDARGALEHLATAAIEGIGLFVLIVNVVRTPGLLRASCWAILIAGAFLGGLSAVQELTGTYGNPYWGFAQVKDAAGGFFTGAETLTGRVRQPELTGPIGDPNFYAQIMLMLVPVGMARVMAERMPYSLIALGCTMLVGAGTILTFSRGAAVAGLVLVVGMVVIRFIRVRHIAVALVAFVALSIAVPEYVGRVGTLDVISSALSGGGIDDADVSVQSRATENLAAALVFLDHPLTGVGPGQFPVYYQEYANRVGLEVQVADREAHTLYLGIAAESGILGLVSFLGILGTVIIGILRVRGPLARIDRPLAITVTGLALSVGAFMLTGIFLHLAYARYAWLMIALAATGLVIARGVVSADARASRRASLAR
jgi:putative inorganic carbon (hco3(-)) transporter